MTSSIAAASTATSGPRWLSSQTFSTGLEATKPATWKTVSQPRIALRIAVEVEDLALDGLDLEVAEAVEALRVAVAGAHVVAALDEGARDVGADEAGGAGDEDGRR